MEPFSQIPRSAPDPRSSFTTVVNAHLLNNIVFISQITCSNIRQNLQYTELIRVIDIVVIIVIIVIIIVIIVIDVIVIIIVVVIIIIVMLFSVTFLITFVHRIDEVTP